MSQTRREKGKIGISIRDKLLILTISIAVPSFLLVVYLLISVGNYTSKYDQIVSQMTIANSYNLNFKEEMDESLYKLVVGYVDFDSIDEDDTLKNPYQMIRQLRTEFTRLMNNTTEAESRVWLQSLLRNINTLEKRVDDIRDSLQTGGQYDENIEKLENNIYILTELIQDDIQYYIYYQTKSMENVTKSLNEQISRFIIVSRVFIVLLAVTITAIAILLARGILNSVQELYAATEKVASGDFSARANVRSHDEMAVLAEGFNDMAENMQSLIDQIKEDEGKMRRADLRLLQEQINPHFLYNTLDTIVWLIEDNEQEKAVNMVVTLSDFFRVALSKGKEFISIREEEQHIRSYLSIQEVRYHDIMEYDIQIDKVLYDYQILKLTLQPLVENSLYHGLKYKRAKGFIHITGEKEGDVLHLAVRDSGVGMDEAELAELREEISRPCQETEKGFGLANVNERIKMHFGQQYGMTITSQKGKGTLVEITIPAIKMVTEERTDNAVE